MTNARKRKKKTREVRLPSPMATYF